MKYSKMKGERVNTSSNLLKSVKNIEREALFTK